jgi:hypothetical protein
MPKQNILPRYPQGSVNAAPCFAYLNFSRQQNTASLLIAIMLHGPTYKMLLIETRLYKLPTNHTADEDERRRMNRENTRCDLHARRLHHLCICTLEMLLNSHILPPTIRPSPGRLDLRGLGREDVHPLRISDTSEAKTLRDAAPPAGPMSDGDHGANK